MRNTKKKSEPHPIDILAGERVREIRLLKGMTQGELGTRKNPGNVREREIIFRDYRGITG